MREKFGWYLSPSEAEIAEIWTSGTLTLDANVLLDLYRYHAQTRESLLQAIRGFGQRTWITDQAANEFFKNRKTVVASADTTFREADQALAELLKAVETAVVRLRSKRLIPREGLDEMDAALKRVVEEASSQIAEANRQHPDYLKDDPLLAELIQIFDGKVGAPPTEQQLAQLLAEGERRHNEKIPPGFLDEGKEGDSRYGDYVLWSQVLDHAGENSSPIVLVTSEQKPDWWEIRSNRRVGPRPEMLKEAYDKSGQRILIYQTDLFLKEAASRLSQHVDAANVSESLLEIQDFNARRDRNRNVVEAAISVDHIVDDTDIIETSGSVHVVLLRPVQNFTATVKLDPEWNWPEADESVTLNDKPKDAPQLLLRAKLGPNRELNIHCHSSDREKALPLGEYVFGYNVSVYERILADIDIGPASSSDAGTGE